MEISMERLVAIICCMYGKGGELVEDIEHEECYVTTGVYFKRLPVVYEEIQCLLSAKIVEVDSGSDEMYVYRLTEKAQEKMQEFIRNKKLKTRLLK